MVPASSLGHPVGEITPEGLALVRTEREICAEYWRRQRGRQVYLGNWKQSYIPRPLNPTTNGHKRSMSFANNQLGGERLQRGQTEPCQMNRSNIGEDRVGEGGAGGYQIEGGQLERGQIKGQIGLTRKDRRRWSMQ